MTIEEEMARLPNLRHVGIALVQFVYSLQKGSFVKKTEWVYSAKFVAFAINYRRVEKIHLTLMEYPEHVEDKEILPLYAGRWNYPRGEITNPRQLACAARYVEECHRMWLRKILGK